MVNHENVTSEANCTKLCDDRRDTCVGVNWIRHECKIATTGKKAKHYEVTNCAGKLLDYYTNIILKTLF